MKIEKNVNVIISTGQGRLHLFQSAIALKNVGADVRIITGWVPSGFFSDKVINLLGGLVGRKGNLAAGLKKRSPLELNKNQVYSCTASEFTLQFLFKLSSNKIISRSTAAILGWKMFGKQSKKYIHDAQIFHVRSGAGVGGAIEHARKKGMHIIVDHSIAHPREMESQLNKAYKNENVVKNKYTDFLPTDDFWKTVLQDCIKADILLVNSLYVKDSFVKNGYPDNKIRIAQLGVNPEFNAVKKSYNIGTYVRLIFTGGFGIRKGAALIIKALLMLRSKGINYRFEVVGSTMGDLVIPDEIGNNKDVIFHGHLPQNEMLPILLSGDIYIFPTYVEGCAQTVKEAMAVGLPVITTFQSGAPIQHKENGFLIEDDNALALALAIEELVLNNELREKIGRNASETISQDHTWLKYGQDVLSIYKELI